MTIVCKCFCFVLFLGVLSLAAKTQAEELRADFSRSLQEGEDHCECSVHDPCSECERCDCDSDHECEFGLVCYQRDKYDPVPGCPYYSTDSSTDYCAKPQTRHPTLHFTPHPTPRPTYVLPPYSPPVPAPVYYPPPVPSPDDLSVVVCLSGNTKVQVAHKGDIPMKTLQVGDNILSAHNKYETVYAFAHHHSTIQADFLDIHTSDGNHLEITSEHLLYIQGKNNPVRAGSISPGHVLLPSNASVTKIRSIAKKGIYAPLTPSGTLIVNNGVQVSSYAVLLQDTDEYVLWQDGTPFVSQHDFIHALLTPFRMVCRARLAMGFSPCESYNDNGLAPVVDGGIHILRWVNQRSTVGQMFLLALACLPFGILMAVEKLLFGAGITALIGLYVGVRMVRNGLKKNHLKKTE